MSGAATDAAAIGMSCSFPDTHHLGELWHLLLDGKPIVRKPPDGIGAPLPGVDKQTLRALSSAAGQRSDAAAPFVPPPTGRTIDAAVPTPPWAVVGPDSGELHHVVRAGGVTARPHTCLDESLHRRRGGSPSGRRPRSR
ncbi:hypothetical protein [Streptomyces albipurpureus]|uniref:Beta-ketoacyl synthase N-terminal domain-containing protein n=1 Tax=Streptomyces albipurpureus TaxID=2897419 RepID=A0ABT0URM4_9ACTN|nr:hypothetical protein [Streptomyces sp. CWNU-1]MCM2390038.1 hypothetical protein [Streptomyces sp. CWNU-1]